MIDHPKNVVLLDLDGTLTQSHPGIFAAVAKAFEAVGRPVPDDEELHRFIGPAIVESLERNGIHGEDLDKAVEVYRYYYSTAEVFDDPNEPGKKVPGRLYNSVYPGIPEQMERLREKGYYLAVATCKPEPQAIAVCDHFHITGMVDGVYGASMDSSRLDKDQVIRYCFECIGYDESVGDKAVMVGDRWTDMDGAAATGIGSIGCRWGYAEPNELEDHGASMIIDTVDQLAGAVDTFFAE
ncbi:haloacid dehalogenase [Bifidobacterium primatium]|uniref:Haloacid dehalogenase n=1 Tax=Bifidobacterium primatium TaxID=2045438 RepID=A0A2M9H7U4_9BIFI|nr:HAD hydrolase-like protein [Bifidobacterium primatium]PJM72877.1 haloacid dehalogenase [Bifidobacterium primatium]